MADPKTPNDELDKFLLRMPRGLREKLKAVAEGNNRSMNAEIVGRLEFSLIAHTHAYLIRALLALQEDLLGSANEVYLPDNLKADVVRLADERGMSSQRFLTALLIEAIGELDNNTEIGQELSNRIYSMIETGEAQRHAYKRAVADKRHRKTNE